MPWQRKAYKFKRNLASLGHKSKESRPEKLKGNQQKNTGDKQQVSLMERQ